jgi:hypothetical protein
MHICNLRTHRHIAVVAADARPTVHCVWVHHASNMVMYLQISLQQQLQVAVTPCHACSEPASLPSAASSTAAPPPGSAKPSSEAADVDATRTLPSPCKVTIAEVPTYSASAAPVASSHSRHAWPVKVAAAAAAQAHGAHGLAQQAQASGACNHASMHAQQAASHCSTLLPAGITP